MARIVLVLVVLAAGSAVGAALFAHGSQAAPQRSKVVRPQLGPAPVPGPAALPEAPATIQRTFVSTSGDDLNACTRAAPCRNFAAAIAQTTAGGEVVALDSGGYGSFTVDKSITIAGAPGSHVAISVFSGTGITVNIGTTDTVVLRNLYLTGLGGDTGIFFPAGGRLFVDSIVASGFAQRALTAAANGGELFVRDSLFRNNDIGVFAEQPMRVEITDSRADRNDVIGFGFGNGPQASITRSAATRNGFAGFEIEFTVVLSVSDSVADGNDSGVAAIGPGAQVTLSRVVLSNNVSYGLGVASSGGVARIGGSTVTGNGTGLAQLSGTLESFGDNMVRGNTTETSGTITTVAKS